MANRHGRYVMTIDAGTGSGRALVFDLAGNQVGAAQQEWTMPAAGYPGSAAFDTAGAWRLICQCIRQALARAGVAPAEVCAVSASSMREGMVLYDGRKREIWACPNIDARARAEAEQMAAEGLADEIYETGGDWLGIISPPRFRWLARHQPDVLDRMRHMSMISDWVLLRLCGELATDRSCGSSSGLFDLAQGTWSGALIGKLGLREDVFPRVHESGTVLGGVTATAADETGLVAGTPVVVGGADTQLALLASGGTGAGRLTVVGGTFWQTTWLADRPLVDGARRLRTLCHVLPGVWMTEGIGFLNGLAMRWLRDTVCGQLTPDDDGDGYALMEALAAEAPAGADGVVALVSDVMHARRWIQAPTSIVGLNITDPAHAGRRGQGLLVRAVEESAAFTALAHYRILQELSGQSAADMVFCGGASKGNLWPRIMADVFNLPVRIPVVKETTSLGSALCALVGLREFASLSEAAAALVRWDRTVEPDAATAQVYGPICQRALALQRGLIEWVESGRLGEMWRAAGVPEIKLQASHRTHLAPPGAVGD